jgi:hypothetical protein
LHDNCGGVNLSKRMRMAGPLPFERPGVVARPGFPAVRALAPGISEEETASHTDAEIGVGFARCRVFSKVVSAATQPRRRFQYTPKKSAAAVTLRCDFRKVAHDMP